MWRMPLERRRTDVRVGHADRDRVIEILNSAAAEGRLTIEELESRIETASAARFESELDALIADLPAGQRAPATPPALVPTGRNGVLVPQGALVLHAGWSNIIRAGRWNVPEWIDVSPSWAAVVLNFLDAVPPPGGEVNIHLRGSWGSLIVILPEGWAINRDALTTASAWSDSKFEAPTIREPGKPLVRLSGDAREGRVRVRRERWWDKYFHASSKN